MKPKKNKKKNNGDTMKELQIAFLEFKDEATCIANFKLLQNSKIRGKEIIIEQMDDDHEHKHDHDHEHTHEGEEVKKENAEKNEKKENAEKNEKKENGEKNEKKVAEEVKDTNRVYIKGFDKNATEADLKELLAGSSEFTLPIKKDTKLNMGFAFATYASEEAATKAIKTLNGTMFGGKKLSAVNANVRSETVETKASEEPAVKKVKTENGKAAEVKKKASNKGDLKRKAVKNN